MKLRRFILAAFIFAMSAAAQTAVPSERSAQIDQIVSDSMHKQQIPAMTVAVAVGSRISYSKAFGTADLENGIPATTETLIRTGSIAKPISAVATMTLVESGKLDLEAPVQKYCPQFPVKPWAVTTRELLSHTSGIRHYKGDEPQSTRHYKSMTDGFSIFANDPLLFEPGTSYSYSTYGYTVVGCVVEGASGERFSDYVAEHVLKPAGMTHTFVDDVFEIVPHRARGYQKIGGQVKNAGLMDSSYKIPGGGYVTTAEDLMHFAQALMDGKILKPETLALMWNPTKLTGGKISNYGLGFGVLMIGEEKYVTHNGSQQGTSTAMAIIPGKHFAAAALANMDGVDPFEVIREILKLLNMPYPKN
ncbi:MAG TPA: serine hydrolase domain-containing protein [Candidatus Angelobacter sp.]|jgi:CubicO group peptidase (beta-lactamase class C family)|nr:serine hydrolase domain-containing protein [Candidatus Angelobacter sp.]